MTRLASIVLLLAAIATFDASRAAGADVAPATSAPAGAPDAGAAPAAAPDAESAGAAAPAAPDATPAPTPEAGAPAAAPPPSPCLKCHPAAPGERERTIPENIQKSVHRELGCADCHEGVDAGPHATKPGKVNCGNCHEDAVKEYEWHGRLKVPGQDLPTCADCHGRHDILKPIDNNSRTHPRRLPETCGTCHRDLNLLKRHDVRFQTAIDVFETSVHGMGSRKGVDHAATCHDCHGDGRTAHRILSAGNTDSPVNHFNIPKTCGKCHRSIENEFWEGIHGRLVARGKTDAPVCTTCHGEHGILSHSDPRSPVSPTRVAEATCSPCHESARLNEKYGVETGRLRSFVDTYHGLKSRTGDVTVANCASCHGAHRILPHTEPSSSIHPQNLGKTCGSCHPGISAAVAETPIHGAPGMAATPLGNLIRQVYIWVIFIVIGFMFLYTVLDFRRRVRMLLQKPQIRRMTIGDVLQHTLLMLSFIVLVVTGFALRFSEADWVQLLFGWEGGFPIRGLIHRGAAVVFLLTVAWHLLFLLTRRGRGFFRDMLPRPHDFKHFFQKLAFYFGRRPSPPRVGRFSYVEKAEYWALVWGTVVMAGSGFFLWFENLAVEWFPKGFLDIMLVLHYYEAWLATLAILVWHLYTTVFSPAVYPMNPAWLTGTMPADMYEEEHPDDPLVKEHLAKHAAGSGTEGSKKEGP